MVKNSCVPSRRWYHRVVLDVNGVYLLNKRRNPDSWLPFGAQWLFSLSLNILLEDCVHLVNLSSCLLSGVPAEIQRLARALLCSVLWNTSSCCPINWSINSFSIHFVDKWSHKLCLFHGLLSLQSNPILVNGYLILNSLNIFTLWLDRGLKLSFSS